MTNVVHIRNYNTDKDHQYDHHDHYYNNYNNNRYTAPGVLSDADHQRIASAYADNIATQLTGAVIHLFTKAINAGITVDQIIDAINITGFAPRPSPAYLRAILINWMRSGVTSSTSRPAAQARPSNPALNYQQHTYTEDDFGKDFFFDPSQSS